MKAAILVLAICGVTAIGSSEHRLDTLDRRITDLEAHVDGYRAHLRKLDTRVGRLNDMMAAEIEGRRELSRAVGKLKERCAWFDSQVEELRR